MSRLPREDWLRIAACLTAALRPLMPPGTILTTETGSFWLMSGDGGRLISRGFGFLPLPRAVQVRTLTRSALQQILDGLERQADKSWPWRGAGVRVHTERSGTKLKVRADIVREGSSFGFDFVV